MIATMARPYAFARFGSAVGAMTCRQGDSAEAAPVRQPVGKSGQLQPDQRESDRYSEHHAEEHRRGRSARGEVGPCAVSEQYHVDVSDASLQMLDDSKKFKWGAKKLNYVVGAADAWEVDAAEEVRSVGGTRDLCGGRAVFPFPIDVWVFCLLASHSFYSWRGFSSNP